jgi:hypothetical protein
MWKGHLVSSRLTRRRSEAGYAIHSPVAEQVLRSKNSSVSCFVRLGSRKLEQMTTKKKREARSERERERDAEKGIIIN